MGGLRGRICFGIHQRGIIVISLAERFSGWQCALRTADLRRRIVKDRLDAAGGSSPGAPSRDCTGRWPGPFRERAMGGEGVLAQEANPPPEVGQRFSY